MREREEQGERNDEERLEEEEIKEERKKGRRQKRGEDMEYWGKQRAWRREREEERMNGREGGRKALVRVFVSLPSCEFRK